MKQVIVMVPVYRTNLSATELVAWTQVRRVLGAHDLCVMAPASLLLVGPRWAGVRVERFDDACFRDRDSYSELMLSPSFYERFEEYEYLLVYQLDAFVFSDRLLEFCAMGYDYIGAPIHRHSANWIDIGCNVGNGGFSLRKISSTLRVLEHKEAIFRRKPKAWKQNMFLPCEDLFFAFCSTIPELDFHVPEFLPALDFAVGWDIGHAFDRMPAWMPFGCHGWNLSEYWFWKPIIESYGYVLPEPKGAQKIQRARCRAGRHILERLPRASTQHRKKVFEILAALLPDGHRRLALWGGGTYRRVITQLLRRSGRDVAVVFDRSATASSTAEGVALSRPDVRTIREQALFVLVTTTTYEEEICEELSSQELSEGRDYLRISELLYRVTRRGTR